jgi:hypothetical protein
MAILIHVAIALTSIAATSIVFIRPSRAMLGIAYALIAGTIASGAYLIAAKQAALLPTCETGLVYLAAMLAAVFAARHRLAAQSVRSENQT